MIDLIYNVGLAHVENNIAFLLNTFSIPHIRVNNRLK